jgi:hypothetical protein
MISAGYMPATIAMQISIGPIANQSKCTIRHSTDREIFDDHNLCS